MKIVIDMPKDIYAEVCAEVEREIHPNQDYRWVMVLRSICNGIPLPRGHGRLIDADKIRNKIYNEELFYGRDGCEYDYGKGCGLYDARELVESAPKIIEADKEGANE